MLFVCSGYYSTKITMMKSENPNNKDRHELLLPKRAIPIVWAVIVLAIQVVLPWVVAKIGPRFGWYQGDPGWWNLAGLIMVLIGICLYAWCLVFHYRSYRTSVRVGFSPPHLVIAGPYQISRNPMYVSGLFAWLGWTVFYGSPAVFVALLLLWSLFTFRMIPYEERQLEALFGYKYLEYKRSVRRWIGRY
jgi:protein-S-isoprenylcysteine O-methyltransferase Ste14